MTALRLWATIMAGMAMAGCAATTDPATSAEDAPPPVQAPPPKTAMATPRLTPPRPSQPSTPPQTPQKSSAALHCDRITARQDNRDIRPQDGDLILARKPFALIYSGQQEPALYLSPSPRMNEELDQAGAADIWTAGDEFLSLAADDLPLRSGGGVINGDQDQDDFLSLLGTGYPSFFRQMVAMNHESQVVVSVPKTAQFQRRGEVRIQQVNSIAGIPVTMTNHKVLNLTYFGLQDRMGPGSKGSFGSRLLLKMNWGSCRLVFP